LKEVEVRRALRIRVRTARPFEKLQDERLGAGDLLGYSAGTDTVKGGEKNDTRVGSQQNVVGEGGGPILA